MRITEVARKLTEELGIHITVDRIYRYEERGIIPQPTRKEGKKDYSIKDVERIKKVIILSEAGIPLSYVRNYILGKNVKQMVDIFKTRINDVGRLVGIARNIRW